MDHIAVVTAISVKSQRMIREESPALSVSRHGQNLSGPSCTTSRLSDPWHRLRMRAWAKQLFPLHGARSAARQFRRVGGIRSSKNGLHVLIAAP